MKKIIAIFLFTCVVFPYVTKAQVAVEDAVTTDTIDLFVTQEESQQKKSPALAMLGNILFPGLGYQYIGNRRRAMAYFVTETFLIFGMVFCKGYSKKLYSDSRSYAWMYAGTESVKDEEDNYWKIIGNKNYMNYEEYNDIIEHNRTPENKYVNGKNFWAWEDEFYRDTYRNMRNDAMHFHIISSFFLGAMILNRAVSFIDIRFASRSDNSARSQKKSRIQPYYSFHYREVGISLSRDF